MRYDCAAIEKRLIDLEYDGIEPNFRVIMSLRAARREKYARVLKELERGLAAFPRSARLHALKGKVLSNLSLYPQARAALKRSIALDGKCALTHAWLGQTHLLDNSVSRAMRELDAAVALDAGCAWAYFYRSAARYIMGDAPRAEADLRRALATKGDAQAAAKAFMSLLDAKSGRYEGALGLIEEVAGLFARKGWPLVLRAVVRRMSGDKAGAAADFGAALEAEPQGWVYLERAGLQEEMGNLEGALKDVESALRLEGPGEALWVRLCRLRTRLGRCGEAVADLRRALKWASPDGRAAGLELAQALRDLGRGRAALAALGALARAFPGDIEVLPLLTQTLCEQQRPAEAEAAARLAVALSPGAGAARLSLVEILMRQKRFTEAEAAIGAAEAAIGGARRACGDSLELSRISNNLTVAREGAARSSMLEGRLAQACRAYERAWNARPDRWPIAFPLAECLLRRGELAAMTRALKKAQGSIPRRADDVATLVGRLRLALCLCDLDAAARWGEALLDKTLRYDDLNALYRPVLFDTDSLVVRSAPRRFGLRVMTAFERYLDTHPDSPWASYYYRIFGAKLRCGLNWTRDEACLRTLKALPLARYGWMRYHIGLDSLMKRDFAGAVEQFSLGVTHSVGRDWRSRCHIGEALLCQGDAPAALSSFDETLKDDPGANRPLIQAWKAEVLLWAGDYRGALAVSQEALQKNAAGLAFCWKGGALVKLGRPLLALEPLGLAIAVWPADIEARVWRSEALYRLGRPREALLEAQTAKKIDRGSNFYCSVAAGLARFALGDVKGMRRELSELPSAVINHVARQTGFDSSGSADAAAKTLEAVLSLSQGVRRGAYETAAWLSSSKMLSRGH